VQQYKEKRVRAKAAPVDNHYGKSSAERPERAGVTVRTTLK